MPNTITITDLAGDIYVSRDQVAREAVGFANSVVVNGGSEKAAFGDTVRSHRTSEPTLNTSYTPSMTIPSGDDQTITNDTLTIDQVANVRIPLTGETIRSLNNGSGAEVIRQDMFKQAFRKITNTIEAYLAGVIYKGASRATGTAGTTPFATNFNSLAALRQILFDNGAPCNDGQISAVINSLAGTNLRSLAPLQKANESGSTDLLRKGELLNLLGFSLKESAGITAHTAGAGTGYDIGAAGEAVGQTTLTLEGGTVNTTGIKAGDVISFDTDTANKYVVKTGLAAVAGDIVIGAPGLRVAGVTASELTIGASYTPNVGLHKSAVELVMRPPDRGNDARTDEMIINDPVSGLSFSIAQYKGYGMEMIDITCFYTAKVWKPEFVAVLLG